MNRSGKDEIEAFALKEFSILTTLHGYSEPMIRRNTWATKIDFLKGNLGLEIVLDWRDLSPFLLLVKLTDRKLPGDGYVKNGVVVREYLENVARKNGWISNLPRTTKTERRITNEDEFRSVLLDYKERLLTFIDVIDERQSVLF